MPRHGNCKYPPKMANRVFRMVDSGVPITKAANALELPYGTAYRLLEEEESRQKRRANRGKRVLKTAGANREASARGGRKAQAAKRMGHVETHAEHLARLAPLLESVTREWAKRGREEATT